MQGLYLLGLKYLVSYMSWEQCAEGLSALQDPEDAVPVGQRRAWCWCMCFGLAFMLAGVILGGAYLYKYFAFQVSQIHFVMGGLCFSLLCLTFRRGRKNKRLNQTAFLLFFVSKT